MPEESRSYGPFEMTPIQPVRHADGSVDVEATIRKVDRTDPWWSRVMPGFRRRQQFRADLISDGYARLERPPTE